jgi:TolA-binding protein
MAKKIVISFSVVFGSLLAFLLLFFVFSLVAAEYSADAAAQLEQAKAYEAEGNYEQAEAVYRTITTDYPGTDEASEAQKNLALLVTRNYPAAQAEVDALIAGLTEHQDSPQVIYDLANSYWYAEKFEQARQVYKYIVDNLPNNNLAMRAQAWVAACEVKLRNYIAANQEIAALMKDFPDNPELTGVIYQLADEYWYSHRYEDSRPLYQCVLDRDPNGELAVWAKGWITGLELILRNSVSAQQVIDVLVRDCTGQSQLVLGRILYGNANGCWYVRKYKEARELYKYIADNLPESNRFMRAKAWVAGADIMLGNYAAAQEKVNAVITDFAQHPDLPGAVYQLADVYWNVKRYDDANRLYQYLLDNWPDYIYAWEALFSIGDYYERLRDSGSLPESEANRQIEQVYKAVIEKYSDTTAVRNASKKLGWLNFKRGQWVEAIQYWELCLQRSPEDYKPVHILYPLGRAYEEIGQFDLAIQVYNEFINRVPSIDPSVETVKARLEKLGTL